MKEFISKLGPLTRKNAVSSARLDQLRSELASLFYGATNFERAYPIFSRVGFDSFMKKLSFAHEGDFDGELDKWFSKEYVKWSPAKKEGPNDWMFETLVHNTNRESYWQLERNPFGVLNAVYSSRNDGFGHAESGDGFYVFGKAPPYAAYGENRIYFRTAQTPDTAALRRGSALKDEATILYAEDFRIIPETFPSSPAALADAFVRPESFADPGNPGKITVLHRRIDRNWSPELVRELDRALAERPDNLLYYLQLKKGPEWDGLKRLIDSRVAARTLTDEELFGLFSMRQWKQAPEMSKWVRELAKDEARFARLATGLAAANRSFDTTGNHFAQALLEIGERNLANQALRQAMQVPRLRSKMIDVVFTQESSAGAKRIFAQQVKLALKEKHHLPVMTLLDSVYRKPHSVAFEDHLEEICAYVKRTNDSQLNDALIRALYQGPDTARRLQRPEIRALLDDKAFRSRLSAHARQQLLEIEKAPLKCTKAFEGLN